MKKALIIAPHPDDEINLAGQFSVWLKKKKFEIFVLYTTNGDAEKKIGNKRIEEAINANAVLGIDEEHVIVLGYPNEWASDVHIYNAQPNMILSSKLGKTRTNSISGHPEFCFQQHGVHHDFTRDNLKGDFKEAINLIHADIIIAPEFDSHPDHRMTSLLFDEIIGEILKEKREYQPVILKKYIHEGVWNGPKDYYFQEKTKTAGARYYSGGMHELDSPCFTWSERISYFAEQETCTELLSENIVYKAAKKHKVTTAWYEMQRVLNSDIVYWPRPVQNLCLYSKISASSGNVNYINDFKRYDCGNIYFLQEPFEEASFFCWHPEDDDSIKSVEIEFAEKSAIQEIVIYEDCNYKNHIKKLKIVVEDKEYFVEPDGSGASTKVSVQCAPITKITFQILAWEGIPGIAEIEIFAERTDKPFAEKLWTEKVASKKEKIDRKQKLEKIIFMFFFFFSYKLQYEIKRLFIKHGD